MDAPWDAFQSSPGALRRRLQWFEVQRQAVAAVPRHLSTPMQAGKGAKAHGPCSGGGARSNMGYMGGQAAMPGQTGGAMGGMAMGMGCMNAGMGAMGGGMGAMGGGMGAMGGCMNAGMMGNMGGAPMGMANMGGCGTGGMAAPPHRGWRQSLEQRPSLCQDLPQAPRTTSCPRPWQESVAHRC